MIEIDEILQLRFEGNGISPDKVKPSEISELINEFQNVLLSTIKQEHREIDITSLLFSLDSIRKESLGINFKALQETILPDIRQAVVGAYLLITTSINTKDFSNLNSNSISSLKKIAAFSKKYSCNGHFNRNGETLSTITPTTEIRESQIPLLKGTTTIYGEVIDVGANIHLKLNDGSKLYIDVDKKVSKQLGTRLWDYVGLRGIAKWDPVTFKIIEFKYTEILEFSPGSVSQTFSDLRELTSGAWDKFDSNDDINNQLLKD